MQRHQGAKVELFDVSNMIYHKFSHSAISYMLNGEIQNQSCGKGNWLNRLSADPALTLLHSERPKLHSFGRSECSRVMPADIKFVC